MPRLVRTWIGQMARLWRPALTLLAVILLPSACVRYFAPTEAAGVVRYVAAVQALEPGATATIRIGTPSADPAAPELHTLFGPTALEGGTSEVTATSVTSFSRIAVVIPGTGSYWDVTLPRPTTIATLRLTFAERLPAERFDVRMSAAASGAYGAAVNGTVDVLAVGDDDRVMLEWDSPAELAVRAVDRSEGELGWNAEQRTAGIACGTANPEQRNAWTGAGLVAPAGTYRVRLSYAASCTLGATRYAVTVIGAGGTAQFFRGVLPGAAERARVDETIALADR